MLGVGWYVLEEDYIQYTAHTAMASGHWTGLEKYEYLAITSLLHLRLDIIEG